MGKEPVIPDGDPESGEQIEDQRQDQVRQVDHIPPEHGNHEAKYDGWTSHDGQRHEPLGGADLGRSRTARIHRTHRHIQGVRAGDPVHAIGVSSGVVGDSKGTRHHNLVSHYQQLITRDLCYVSWVTQWTFLSSHGRVLLRIAGNPEIRLREIAADLGITERSAYAIVDDLVAGGYVLKEKQGRRNRYQIQTHLPFPDGLDREQALGDVLAAFTGVQKGKTPRKRKPST